MPKRNTRPRLDKNDQRRDSPNGDWRDWLLICLLGLIVAYAVYHLGGHHPKAELTQSWMLGGLLAMHGIFMISRQAGYRRFHGAGLLFLPFLAYAGIRCVYQSPMPWRGWEEFLVLCQGWVVFWVVLHHLRTRRQALFLLAVLCLVGLMTFMAACYQHVENPQWLPMGRKQLWYFGRASGTFGAAPHFGACMGLLSTLLFFLAASSRFTLVGRLLCVFLALIFGAGLVASGSRGGWIGIIAAFLSFPYFLTSNWWHRMAGWAAAGFLTAALALVLYFQVDLVQVRVDQLIEGRGESTRKWMWTAAWDIFKDNPALGSGTASYELLFERYRLPEAQIAPIYAHNDYLNTLSNLGLLGFILFFGPCALILHKGWRAWLKKPFRVVIKERQGNRRGTPFSKMMLGGLLVVFIGFGLHLFVDFHLELPALLFMTAIFLGMLVVNSTGRKWQGIRLRGKLAAVLWLSLCLFGGGLLALRGSSTFMAALRYLEGDDLREDYVADFSRYREDRPYVEKMVQKYEAALRWEPRHGKAWSDLSLIYIQSYHLDPGNYREIANKAQNCAEKAISITDQSWEPHAYLGMALQLKGAAPKEIERRFRRAIELSPTSVAAWIYYADFLSRYPSRSEEALETLEQALKLDPSSKNAIALKKKLLAP